MDRAIITLQLGHYSNFVGAHFWNIQEGNFVYEKKAKSEACPDPDHNVLFREGRNLQGEVTFTPRLVACDLKGSLGRLPKFGDLYDKPYVPKDEDGLWSGPTHLNKTEGKPKNSFQRELEAEENSFKLDDDEKDICEAEAPAQYDLDDQVEVWSDYLRTRFHPKSVLLLEEYQHENKLKPFDIFGLGAKAWKEDRIGEEFEDSLRFFAEETDSLHGFHLLCDHTDAFGGLSSEVLNLLHEEYPGKAKVVFPLLSSSFQDASGTAKATRFLNTVLSFESLLDNSSLVTPLSVKETFMPSSSSHRFYQGLQFNPELHYHSSAILAAGLDTLTLPWRSRSATTSVHDVIWPLGSSGRKLATALMDLPVEVEPHTTLAVKWNEVDQCPGQFLTPGVVGSRDNEVYLQVATARGIPTHSWMASDFHSNAQYRSNQFVKCHTPTEMLQCLLDTQNQRSMNAVFVSEVGIPTSKPYPEIFKKPVQLAKSSAMTLWQSSKNCGQMLRQLHEQGVKMNIRKYHKFGEAGTEEDEFKESLEHLATASDSYFKTDCL